MPRGNIETFTGNVEAPRADERGSSAYEQLGRHEGAAFSSAASAVRGATGVIGGVIDRHEAIIETTDLGKNFVDFETQSRQAEEQAKITGNPHDPDFVKNFMAAQQDKLGALGDALQTDEGRHLYDTLSNNYRRSTTDRLIGWQGTAAAADAMASAEHTVTGYANIAQADPTAAKGFSVNIAAQAATLPVEVRERWLNQATQTIFDSAGEGIVNRLTSNPDATLKDVENAKALLADPKGGYVGNMSPAQYASINSRLDKAAETIGSTQSQIDAQTLSAGYNKLKMNGGIDQGDALQGIISRYRGASPAATAEFKAKAQREYEDAIQYGKVAKVINSTPDADVKDAIVNLREAIKTASPEGAAMGEARLKAAMDAKAARDKAFNEDPATWLNQNSDVVKTRYSTFAANQTPQNFQAYAAASSAEQRRLYPNATPNIMPAEMEDTIRGALKIDLTTKEGPTAAGAILASYARVGGQYWPQMAVKLRQDKVIPAGMGVAAELYGDPKTQGLGEEVIRATALTPAQRIERFGITAEKADIAANKALEGLTKTMGNVPNGDQLVSDYRTALSSLLQYRGTSNPADATVIAQKLITGRYDVEGTTLRVPKSLGLDAARIGDGAAAVKSDIGAHEIVMPPHFSEMGLSRESYIRQLRDTGRWYANENGSGAILYDEDMHTVRETINGKQRDVELSWGDLGLVADKKPLRHAFKAAAELLGGK